ncbi:MAG: MMPL family transporter, partial [Myxococcota bacterium]
MTRPPGRLEDLLERGLTAWVDAARRRGGAICAGIVALTLVLGVYTALNLRINSDNLSLISENLPSRDAYREFTRLFPGLDNSILLVVDGETPELARSAAQALLDALSARTDHFTEVYIPGGGSFFERNGLLYRDVEDLEEFADQMARLQPVIGELEHDASIANLAALVERGLESAHREGRDTEEWALVLERIGRATGAVYEEFPLTISWEELLLRGSAIEIVTRWVIVAEPVLDASQLLLARDAMASIRDAVAELGLAPERGVRVRVTGNPALNYEEMIGLAWDIGTAGVFCFALVGFVLYLALRSLRLVTAGLVTLFTGLLWTSAFATAAVGELNLFSIVFGVLFIGLGVDFAIHLGMHYADRLRAGAPHEQALRESAASVGSSLVLCAFTTAIGFYAFVPTAFVGFADLGLIAGTGMFVILGLTLTFFPALLSSWLRVDPASLRAPLRFRLGRWSAFARHPRSVRIAALLAALASLAVLPRARLEPNVVAIRDPTTESVQAFDDLLQQTDARSPWFVNVLESDLASAERRAEELAELELVERAITLADYVPADQEEKLEILADVSMLLGLPPGDTPSAPELPVAEQVAALRDLHAFLDAPWIRADRSPLAASVRMLRRQLGAFLERAEREGDAEAALAGLEEILLAGLPEQIDRLRSALDAEPIALADLPPSLRARMLASDGRARIQVFPSEDLMQDGALARFVRGVRPLAHGVGVPVNIVEFGEAVVASFRQALVTAFLAVALLLWLLWRDVAEMALALAPVSLAVLLTGATIVALGIPFTLVSVLGLPLLFGIGVDSGIHLVQRAGRRDPEPGTLLETSTARAVFYSALTTTVSFGSLGLSSHYGMHTLGVLLAIGMAWTVVTNLVVLPALLAWRTPPAP